MESQVKSWKEKVNTITENYVEYKKSTAESYGTLQTQYDKEHKDNKTMKLKIDELETTLKNEQESRTKEVSKLKL